MEKIFLNTITRHMVAEEHQNKFTKGKSKLFKHKLANKSKDVILPPFFFFFWHFQGHIWGTVSLYRLPSVRRQ